MYIILWLLFGAFVGWIASLLMKSNNRMGLIANIIVGLAGSAIGMWLFELTGFGRVNQFTLTGMMVSIGGAVLLLAVLQALSRRR